MTVPKGPLGIAITGGGSGLGRGLVTAFLEEGARVTVLEVSQDKTRQLELDCGTDVVAVCGDVRRYEDNQRTIAAAVSNAGRLDAFVQCAAITDWSPSIGEVDPTQLPAAFDEVMHTNVLGSLLGAKASAPELRRSGGSMVFTLSTSGFFPGGQGALYSLSKHAMVGLVRQLAYENAPTVRVNAVVPGAVRESRIGGPVALDQQDLYPEKVAPNLAESVAAVSPLGQYPSAHEYAPIYLLLADPDRSRLVTGSIMFWDTGINLIGHGRDVMDMMQEQKGRQCS
jgi:2,3-dihydroxy-2,3-dihydrophenylpropionate dehydrogenase